MMRAVQFAAAAAMMSCLTAAPLPSSGQLHASSQAAQDRATGGNTAHAAPAARYVRYFAEGSTGFFETTLGLLNPSPVQTAHVTLTLLAESGGTTSHEVTLGPWQRQTIPLNEILGASAAVSIIVESDVPIAADRWMTWGQTGIGASLDNGAAAPATTWYFAEGATGPFLLYYLLQNPGTGPANVTVRYLLEGAPPLVARHALPPQSRTTLFVNGDDPALAATSLGAVITSDVPIFAERAMYVNAGGTLGGGSVSKASTQAVTDWYFGEGSTGPFFHTFVALLNPGTTPATATVTYHMSDGSTASKSYGVPAEGRRTVYFNGEAAEDASLASLATGPVWFSVNSTHPIVAERVMWWAADWPWYEGHAALGSATGGSAWAVPEGRHGGPAFDHTYVLIGNTTASPGLVRLTLIPDADIDAGAGAGAAVTRDVAIGASDRLTVDIGALFELTDARFSVIVESLGTPATPLAVDYARYRSVNGMPFSGGGATPAVPLNTAVLRGRNLPPSFTAGPDVTVLEDSGPQTIAGWATAVDPGAEDEANQTVSFVVTENTNPLLFSATPAVSPAGTLTFTPAPDANGTAAITLVLQDNGGTANGGIDTSAPATFTITVDPIDDAPIVTAGGVLSFAEDAPAAIVDQGITVTDVDSTTLAGVTVQITGNYVNGEDVLSFANTAAITGVFDAASGRLTLTGTDTVANYQAAMRSVRYRNVSGTPNPSPRSITWIATDGTTPGGPAVSTISVLPVNDAPGFTAGPNVTSWEDTGTHYVTHWATGMSVGPADESSQTLAFIVTNNTNPGLFTVGPEVVPSGTLSYTLAPGASGTADVTLVARDNGGTANGGVDTSAPQTFTITVTDDVQHTTSLTLTTAPANLDMPETYRLRISVPDVPQLLPLTVANVVHALPPGTVFNGSTPAADCQPGCVGTTPATVTWVNPCAAAVGPGSSCDIVVNVTFPGATFPSGTNVTSSFAADATPAGEPSLALGPASLTHPVTTFVPAPAAEITNTLAAGTPAPPTLNQTFSYVLNVQNTGNVPLDNLVVVDTVPVEMQVTSVTTGAYAGAASFAGGEGVRVSYEKNTAPGVFTLWGSSPNTVTNTTLTAPPPGLGAGEYIVRVRWEYGQVQGGMAPSVPPRVTGRIINPDNAGGPVALGDPIQNCADLSSVYTAGPQAVNRNGVCHTFALAGPFAQLDPAADILTGGAPFDVGDLVSWRLRVRSAAESSDSVPLDSIVVTDLVPDGLTFNSWTFDDQGTGLPAPQIFGQVPNFGGTGRTLLRWGWNAGSGSLGVNQQVWILKTTTVDGDVFGSPGTGIATLLNTVAIVHAAPGVGLRCSGSSAADTEDLDADGNTAEIFCTATAAVDTFNP